MTRPKQDPVELAQLVEQTREHYREQGIPDVVPLDISDETVNWLHAGRATVAEDEELEAGAE